jgi:outer membrane immunogenic protein
VLGVETDIGGVTGGTHSNNVGLINGTGSLPGTFFPFALNQRVSNGLFGTARGRLGVAFDRVLVYGTGGLAYTSGHYLFTYTDGLFPAAGTSTTADKIGYVVGGGVEYALNNNVSVKGEFLYTQYGKVSTSGLIVNQFNPSFTNTFATSARVQEYTARVGINYRFNWFNRAPVVAKY